MLAISTHRDQIETVILYRPGLVITIPLRINNIAPGGIQNQIHALKTVNSAEQGMIAVITNRHADFIALERNGTEQTFNDFRIILRLKRGTTRHGVLYVKGMPGFILLCPGIDIDAVYMPFDIFIIDNQRATKLSAKTLCLLDKGMIISLRQDIGEAHIR